MISSKDNELIKFANQIKTKKYSRENNLCLVESIKIVSELYLKNRITNILVTEDKYDLVKKYTNAKIDVISNKKSADAYQPIFLYSISYSVVSFGAHS